jgi:hypothetical protein
MDQNLLQDLVAFEEEVDGALVKTIGEKKRFASLRKRGQEDIGGTGLGVEARLGVRRLTTEKEDPEAGW